MNSQVLAPLPQETIDYVKELIEARITYQILSLGGGVQSAALWLMNMMELIEPRAEFAVFADTMWERTGTYQYLDYLDEQAKKFGFPPIMRVSAGNIREDMLRDGDKHYDHMPLYTESGSKRGGQLNRQCTNFYKIAIIKREVRKIFGMKKRVQWIGFSMDEISRRNDSNFPQYIQPRYPLLEMRLDRDAVKKWFKDNGHPEPVKSSCIGCPFRKDSEWLEMKEKSPDEFADGCDFDRNIRHKHINRPKREIIQLPLFPESYEEPSYDLFVHRNIKPLEEVVFDKSRDPKHEQIQEDCLGGCHI